MMYCFFFITLVAAACAQFPPELSVAIQPPPLQQQLFPQQLVRQQPIFPQQQQFVAVQPPQTNFQGVPPPPGQVVPQLNNYAHRAVVQNAAREAQLPPHLLNPFYKNQRIAGALAKSSWFTPGENQVVDREAEKIPRRNIYLVLKNAGFLNRRRR